MQSICSLWNSIILRAQKRASGDFDTALSQLLLSGDMEGGGGLTGGSCFTVPLQTKAWPIQEPRL